MKKRDVITLVVLAIIFVVIFIVMYINKENDEDIDVKNEFNKLTLLTDESTFLSVSDSINKICDYSNTNSQLLSFIMKDNINSADYENMSFKAEQIYVISNLNLYKYYVKGNFYQELMDQEAKYIKTEYFILNYDLNASAFNIEIINSDIYDNAKEEKYIFEVIDNNNYNNFEYSTISKKTRAIMYFNDFITKIYSSSEEAYNLLSSETKNNYFNTYEEFLTFIQTHDNITLESYSIGENEIYIKDNYSIEYSFEINYVLNYNVTINITEE